MQWDENEHPRDENGQFTAGSTKYRQNVSYEDILNDDDIDPLVKPLYKSYIDELNADPKRLRKQAKEEAELRRKILRDLADACDTKLVEFAKEAIEGKIKPTEYYTVGKISDRQRKDIERLTGEKLEADKSVITAKTITEHINTRHGENGKADKSMMDMANYGIMNYVLENYDTAELAMKDGKADLSGAFLDKNARKAKQVIFTKKIGVNYVVVEAITDSRQENEVRITSMYIKK